MRKARKAELKRNHKKEETTDEPIEVEEAKKEPEEDRLIKIDALMNILDDLKSSREHLAESEEKYKKSKEMLELAARSANITLWDWDFKTGKLEWSDTVDSMLGYKPNEFPRTIKAWENAIHQKDRKDVLKKLNEHIKKKLPYTVDYRIRKKDGTYVWWRDSGKAFRDKEGKAFRMYGACTDISEQKKTEERNILYSKYFYNSPNSMVLADYEKKKPHILEVNNSFTKFYGYTEKEVRGKNPRILKSGKQNLAFYKRMWKSMLDPKKGYFSEYVVNKRKDGSFIDIILTVITSFDEENKPKYFIAHHVDISEKIKAIKELQKSHELVQGILEKAPFGVYIVNKKGEVEYANPKMEEISGIPKEKLKKINTLRLPIYKRYGITDAIKKAFEGKSFKIGPIQYKSYYGKKKTKTTRLFIGIPIAAEKGSRKALLFIEDLTGLSK